MISLTASAKIPNCNPFRFIRQYTVSAGEKKDFDNVEFQGVRHGDIVVCQSYGQLWMPTDIPVVKFLSSFGSHTAEVLRVSDDQVMSTPTVSLDVQYRGLEFYSTCKCKEKNGFIFIYWENEVVYQDAFVTPNYTINVQGRLPDNENGILVNFQAGDVVSVKPDVLGSFQAGVISSIAYDADSDAYGILTNIPISSLSVTDGQVQITYNQKDHNLYTFVPDFSALDGEYYIKLTLTLGNNSEVYSTEVLNITTDSETLKKSTKIRYKHTGANDTKDRWDFEYDDFNIIRLSLSTFRIREVSGEINLFDQDTGISKYVRAVPKRATKLTAEAIPTWLMDKLQFILSHDTTEINTKLHQPISLGDWEPIQGNDIGNFEATMEQTEDVISNQSPEVSQDLDAFFTPSTSTNAVPSGESQNTTLTDQSGTTFELDSKPSWITLDKSTLVDQEVLQVTFAENTAPTERTGTVIFKSQTYPALTAEFAVIQDGTGGVGDFIEAYIGGVDATSAPVQFDKDGEIIDINVNSSSTWQQGTSLTPPGWTVQIISQTLLRITAPQNANVTTAKIGSIKLELVSNPSVFLTISLNQPDNDGIQEVDPSTKIISNAFQSFQVVINCDAGGIWQAIKNASWITSVVPSSGNGSDMVTVTVSNNPGSQRFSSVTFQNTNIPSNSLNCNITQNG